MGPNMLLVISCIFGSLLLGTTVMSAPKSNSVDSITPCQAKASSLTDCVTKEANKIFKRMENGFKELGIPKMDPLMVPMMSLKSGEGALTLNLDLINATHRGMGKSKVEAARVDPEKYMFELDMTLPEYNIKSTYNVSGRIIMLPIMGTGPAEFTFYGLASTWRFKGEPRTKNGKTHMKINEFIVEIVPKKVTVTLQNLFNGNKQLGDTMNKFLNDNWQEVFSQLKSVIEESFAQILMEYGNRALNKIPYPKIFTDLS